MSNNMTNIIWTMLKSKHLNPEIIFVNEVYFIHNKEGYRIMPPKLSRTKYSIEKYDSNKNDGNSFDYWSSLANLNYNCGSDEITTYVAGMNYDPFNTINEFQSEEELLDYIKDKY